MLKRLRSSPQRDRRVPLLEERLAAHRREQTSATSPLTTRLRAARLRQSACLRTRLDSARGLTALWCSPWPTAAIWQGHNVLVTATGVQELPRLRPGPQGVPLGYNTLYLRLPRLLEEITLARADGATPR